MHEHVTISIAVVAEIIQNLLLAVFLVDQQLADSHTAKSEWHRAVTDSDVMEAPL
jgi:hypothetical protein